MSKCIDAHKTEAAQEHQGDVSTKSPSLSFFPKSVATQVVPVEDSPLMKALRSHFERYQGLTEPRIEHIDSLRPQTDDL